MLSRAVYLTTLIATLFCAAINAYTYQVMYPVWRTLDEPNLVALHRDYLDRLRSSRAVRPSLSSRSTLAWWC
jgi:hypothetical protein